MVNDKDFENILNDCLDRLMNGKSIKSCLASHPKYAVKLKPLLKTAQETMQATSIKPRPEFRQRAAHEFQSAIHKLPVKSSVKHGWNFRWQLKVVLPVAIVLILLAAGSGTVVAATNALPGSPLYSIKMATEQVQLAFTFSDEGKAELYSRFIDYRVEEIVKMVENGDLYQVNLTTERMNSQLMAMSALGLQGNYARVMAGEFGLLGTSESQTALPPSSEGDYKPGGTPPTPTTETTTTETIPAELTETDIFIQQLLENMERNIQILQEQLENAPEEFRAALQDAIDIIQAAYTQIIDNLG
jgi:hypothetical protein